MSQVELLEIKLTLKVKIQWKNYGRIETKNVNYEVIVNEKIMHNLAKRDQGMGNMDKKLRE